MRTDPPSDPIAPDHRRSRTPSLRSIIAASAGPLLIVATVLVVLRGYAFGGRISNEDLLTYWLPMYNFLGKALKSGHIPGWNPFVMSGTPFAADPQSGWMQLMPMILFSAFPVGIGLRSLVVLQPMIAGIGLYAFLRSEKTSRPAATVGGLALALVLATTRLPLSIRFPGALAWTTLMLAATSRYLRARSWSRRVPWALAGALAWGQVAASHLTVGLFLGTGALFALLAVKTFRSLRGRTWIRTLPIVGFLLFLLPVVNLAYLLPRFALASQVSVSGGYEHLSELSRRLTGLATPPFPGLAAGPKWPLNLATHPGRYAGAAVLLLLFAGLWSRRYRGLAAGFAVYGGLSYLLGLGAVAYHIPSALRRLSVIDHYLHHPYWISFGVLLAIGILAGLGVEAWREARTLRDRVFMVLPAAALWLIVPLGFGAGTSVLLFLVAGVVTGAVLMAATLRPRLLVALPVLLVAEIMFTVLQGSSRLPFMGDLKLLATLDRPTTRIATQLAATPLSRALAEHPGARYYAMTTSRGRIYGDRRALQNNESMNLRLENVGGYQAVQLERYWMFVRTLQRQRMKYQYTLFEYPPPIVTDLLHIGWVIAPDSSRVLPELRPVADDGPWILYLRSGLTARATVVSGWTVVPSPAQALTAVARPDFDPARSAVLERDPGIGPNTGGAAAGTATYRSLGPQTVRVDVEAPGPSIVLVRNIWDRNWRAAVDGRATPVLAADYVAQGVPVPGGRHTILLTYDDPTIGYGMLGSAVTISGLAAMAWFLRRREGRRYPAIVGSPEPPGGPEL